MKLKIINCFQFCFNFSFNFNLRRYTVVREILRPDILAFIRDPADPNFNPFQELVEQPVLRHMWRVIVSAIIYGNLVVLMVHAPVMLAQVLLPETFFPLRFALQDVTVGAGQPFMELPVDMLMLHFFAPFILERANPRRAVRWLLHGKAVQVDPMKPTFKAPGSNRLKLNYDQLLSNFAFSFNLRRYSMDGYDGRARPCTCRTI